MVYVACVLAGMIIGAGVAFGVALLRCCPNPLDVMDVERL